MKTTDLFKSNRSAAKLNESFERMFGQKIKLEDFDLHQLQDARNKLRTQISQVRSQSGFNETIENDALTKAQWMLDAINSEIAHREEFIIDSVQEGYASETEMELHKLAQDPDFDSIYDAMGRTDEVGQVLQDMANEISAETGLHGDDDLEKIIDRIGFRLQDEYGDPDFDTSDEPDDSMDGDHDSAMASAGFGSDEDYGYYGNDESQQNEYFYFDKPKGKDRGPRDHGHDELDRRAKSKPDLGGKDARDYKDAMKKGQYKIAGPKGKLPEDQDIEEKAPPGAKAERMVKHIKKGYAKDGKLTDKERGIAYATAWKHHNKSKSESTQTGEDMKKLAEGEIQQAQSIVTAKTMVDRVGRWIEELSGMENDTLLQLGDQIRDEMGSEQAKNFISAVAPAIQQALENLKTTRETLATGVRTLTGEEQGAEMLGGEPEMGGEEDALAAEPDMMNAGGEEDAFAAAEPAAGGAEEAGREQRESINYQSRLLKVLAG